MLELRTTLPPLPPHTNLPTPLLAPPSLPTPPSHPTPPFLPTPPSRQPSPLFPLLLDLPFSPAGFIRGSDGSAARRAISGRWRGNKLRHTLYRCPDDSADHLAALRHPRASTPRASALCRLAARAYFGPGEVTTYLYHGSMARWIRGCIPQLNPAAQSADALPICSFGGAWVGGWR